MILQNAEGVKNKFTSQNPDEQNNAILDELESFAVAINTNSNSSDFRSSYRSTSVAYQIIDCFKK
jgi:hypothetical protein